MKFYVRDGQEPGRKSFLVSISAVFENQRDEVLSNIFSVPVKELSIWRSSDSEVIQGTVSSEITLPGYVFDNLEAFGLTQTTIRSAEYIISDREVEGYTKLQNSTLLDAIPSTIICRVDSGINIFKELQFEKVFPAIVLTHCVIFLTLIVLVHKLKTWEPGFSSDHESVCYFITTDSGIPISKIPENLPELCMERLPSFLQKARTEQIDVHDEFRDDNVFYHMHAIRIYKCLMVVCWTEMMRAPLITEERVRSEKCSVSYGSSEEVFECHGDTIQSPDGKVYVEIPLVIPHVGNSKVTVQVKDKEQLPLGYHSFLVSRTCELHCLMITEFFSNEHSDEVLKQTLHELKNRLDFTGIAVFAGNELFFSECDHTSIETAFAEMKKELNQYTTGIDNTMKRCLYGHRLFGISFETGSTRMTLLMALKGPDMWISGIESVFHTYISLVLGSCAQYLSRANKMNTAHRFIDLVNSLPSLAIVSAYNLMNDRIGSFYGKSITIGELKKLMKSDHEFDETLNANLWRYTRPDGKETLVTICSNHNDESLPEFSIPTAPEDRVPIAYIDDIHAQEMTTPDNMSELSEIYNLIGFVRIRSDMKVIDAKQLGQQLGYNKPVHNIGEVCNNDDMAHFFRENINEFNCWLTSVTGYQRHYKCIRWGDGTLWIFPLPNLRKHVPLQDNCVSSIYSEHEVVLCELDLVTLMVKLIVATNGEAQYSEMNNQITWDQFIEMVDTPDRCIILNKVRSMTTKKHEFGSCIVRVDDRYICVYIYAVSDRILFFLINDDDNTRHYMTEKSSINILDAATANTPTRRWVFEDSQIQERIFTKLSDVTSVVINWPLLENWAVPEYKEDVTKRFKESLAKKRLLNSFIPCDHKNVHDLLVRGIVENGVLQGQLFVLEHTGEKIRNMTTSVNYAEDKKQENEFIKSTIDGCLGFLKEYAETDDERNLITLVAPEA